MAAVSNNPEAALLEIDGEKGTEYAVLYYRGQPGESSTAIQPEMISLKDEHDVQSMIDAHHREWVKKYAEE